MTTGRGRHLTFDTNHWKTFAADRLRTPEGAPGCLRLFDAGVGGHRLLADHLTSEYPVSVTGRGRTVEEWKLTPGRDNHWWDTLVGACVAASVLGLTWSSASAAGEPPPPAKEKKLIDIGELYRKQREGKKDPE